jgi:hypothetical protein
MGALSLEAPLVAVGEVAPELDRTGAVVVVVVVAAVAVEVVEELVDDEMSTPSVFVELPSVLVLTELTSFPPSPHCTTVSQPPAKVSSQYDDWVQRAK